MFLVVLHPSERFDPVTEILEKQFLLIHQFLQLPDVITSLTNVSYSLCSTFTAADTMGTIMWRSAEEVSCPLLTRPETHALHQNQKFDKELRLKLDCDPLLICSLGQYFCRNSVFSLTDTDKLCQGPEKKCNPTADFHRRRAAG